MFYYVAFLLLNKKQAICPVFIALEAGSVPGQG